jgi:geranylgeranyl diphosphate synthase type I
VKPQMDTLPYLDRLGGQVDERIGQVTSTIHHRFLRSAVEYALEGGKRIRPQLVILACGAVGGSELDALDAGVAVELLHTASLVHDDIMDRSERRRGRTTLHVLYDAPTAILVGDTLTALAFRTIQNVRSPRKDDVLRLFSSGFVDLCEGQSEDLTLTGTGGTDVASHRTMVEKKTARLLEIAAGIGALIGNEAERPLRCLRCFGMHLGMAFQALDDLLDAVGEEQAVGKPIGSDVRNGKQTYLTVATPAVDKITLVRSLAQQHTEAACDALKTLEQSPARSCLVQMAQSLLTRNR